MSVRHRTNYSLAAFGPWVLLLGCILYGFSLDRYPAFYVDEAFFAYPAVRAAAGGRLAYMVSNAAPFGSQIWAYHGPVLPHLLEWLFKIFGFSLALSRLPNFLGGWLAALLLVLFLKARGYRYAGLAFAVLWCGDRAPQELMYCRMDGLALLAVVLTFLCLERAWRQQSIAFALLCGIIAGFSVLIHPLCLLFAIAALAWTAYLLPWKASLWFCLGGFANLLLLALLWGFRIRDSVTQFLWHAELSRGDTPLHTFILMFSVLRWSRFWFAALLIFAVVSAAIFAWKLWKQGRQVADWWIDCAIAGSFGVVALKILIGTQTHPYYIIYFSVWPMLCLVMLAEKRWRQFRVLAAVMALIWLSSAAWNALRIRESIKFHAELSERFLNTELKEDVPSSARIVATPELYSVPIEDGYRDYDVTTWFPERENICPACFLLMTKTEFQTGDFVERTNMDDRRILYNGPAFPGAGPLDFPIVLLSPEVNLPSARNAAP